MSSEMNKDNITIIAITELLECPICFSNIVDDDPYYIMTCCKNKLHLQCLIDWYSAHSKQNTCFMCNQNNNFSEKFISNNNQVSNTLNDFSNNIHNSSTEIINNERRDTLSTPILNNRDNLSNNTKSCINCISTTILGCLFGILIYFGLINK